MKRAFSDGTRDLVWSVDEFLSRLCALVAPPGVHIVRYHSALASRARGRRALVGPSPRGAPSPPSLAAHDHPDAAGSVEATGAPAPTAPASPAAPTAATPATGTPPLGAPPPDPDRLRRLDWAELRRRTHQIDLFRCPDCGGPRRVVAFVNNPFAARRILRHLGLPADPPPTGAARAPPQSWLPGVDPHPPAPCVDPPSRFT